jgi:hypothetical protein
MTSVQSQMERMKKVYEVHTDKALADVLGKDKNTVSAWKKRGAVPIDVSRRVSLENTISLDWLLTGNGSMRLTGDSIHNIIGQTLQLDSDDIARVFQELLSDADMRDMIELLPYATKEFIGSVKNRLEEFKKLSKI